jgi:hypothetical protein
MFEVTRPRGELATPAPRRKRNGLRMIDKFLELTLTNSVRKAQEHCYRRAH